MNEQRCAATNGTFVCNLAPGHFGAHRDGQIEWSSQVPGPALDEPGPFRAVDALPETAPEPAPPPPDAYQRLGLARGDTNLVAKLVEAVDAMQRRLDTALAEISRALNRDL